MANLVFVPNATSAAKQSSMIDLADIPDDVRKDAEEVYAALKTSPGRMRVEFNSIAELNTYIAQISAYCKQRPEGEIRFRKSPARKLKATEMEFRITDLLTKDEKETEEIRTATDNVKTAAKK